MTPPFHVPLDLADRIRPLCVGLKWCCFMEGGSVISKLLQKHKSLKIINQLKVCGSLLIAGADASQTGDWNQDGDIVEIPAYVIVSEPELPKAESWYYAMVDEFEVLCSGSVEDANRLLARFQMFRQALDIVRPVDDPGYAFSSIILCGKRRQFEQLVPNPDSTDQEHVSCLLRNHEKVVIVIDMESEYLKVSGLSTRLPPPLHRVSVLKLDPQRQLYRQYFRSQLPATTFSSAPPWLVEGICQIVVDIEFSKDRIKYGNIDNAKGGFTSLSQQALVSNDPFGPMGNLPLSSTGSRSPLKYVAGSFLADAYVGDRPFHVILRHQPLIPLEEFFAVQPTDRRVTHPVSDPKWAKQAYAFVHFCYFGLSGKYRDAFRLFTERIATEPQSEELFMECFGVSFKEMEHKLKGYIRLPVAKYHLIKLSKGSELHAEEVIFRNATPSEIARMKGNAMRMAGRFDEALYELRVAYDRGEREAEFLGLLGLEEYRIGRNDRAFEFLEMAVRNGAKNREVWRRYTEWVTANQTTGTAPNHASAGDENGTPKQ